MSLFPGYRQRTIWLILGLACYCLLASLPVSAQNTLTTQDTKIIAGTCFNCHGPGGQSQTSIPSLQGQSTARLLQRMQDFKTDKASDATVMTRLMKGYDDAQIQALAKWFSREEEK